ncbi:hypothetical protein C5167_000174 [Papaver somniferum]|uniref:Uncharacterized protein n=1 Tax=Papaver somniferum TaxID=3469 RepID=A0A4Y7KRV0_PAPSO|nr:hypothetical protein C5167_000174 [Papaver somniferum]
MHGGQDSSIIGSTNWGLHTGTGLRRVKEAALRERQNQRGDDDKGDYEGIISWWRSKRKEITDLFEIICSSMTVIN